MHLLLKLLLSSKLKAGIVSAIYILSVVIEAMRGLIDGASLPEERKAQLRSILFAVVTVFEFLVKFAKIIGANLEEIRHKASGEVITHEKRLRDIIASM